MRRLTRTGAIAALIGLAACGGDAGTANNHAGNEADAVAEPGNAVTAGKPEAAPEGNGAGQSARASSSAGEIRALLIGRWAEDGDCAAATDIRGDGTFTSAQAGDGRWELSSLGYLDLTGSRATIELAVQEIDARTMTTINPQGRIGRWTRC